ncbi:cysteine--tRNA ligase [Candidatus Micrarchaeota archaeon]|nr:cysteine--tRNA ligase [Candidatus Micrarchaeota archaeon]
MFRIFNTLTRKKEAFKPIEKGSVRVYNCGPTAYNDPHIGNYRAYCFADLLRRFLEWEGCSVKQIMNITDVDDKTIRDSQKQKKNLTDFTRHYEKVFFDDLKSLNILPATKYPRATEHIAEMVSLVQKLLTEGKAYKSEDGSVYYAISKFKDYGKLSGLKMKELKEGASGRVNKDEYEKENADDFVLWKAYSEEDGGVFWETPLGKGRPGWHIECSAMSSKYLGESFDVHTGGVDLIFPHHENEIAQSEGASGKKFVNYWLHNEHLLVDGRKMSKSLGNFHTLRDVLAKGFKPLAVRYVLLATHYRTQLNFTFDSITAAENTLASMQDFLQRLEEMEMEKDKGKKKQEKKETNKNNPPAENADLEEKLEETKKQFTTALEDDLNVADALASVFGLEHSTNKAIERGEVSKKLAKKIASFYWNDFNAVFGVLEKKKTLTEKVKLSDLLEIKHARPAEFEMTYDAATPKEIIGLAKEREEARKAKDFKRADVLREEIKVKGFILEDSKKGVRVKKA